MGETKVEQTAQKKVTDLVIGSIISVLGIAALVVAFILVVEKSDTKWLVYLLFFSGAFLFLLASGLIYGFLQEKYNIKRISVKQMCVIGIFSALSVLLYYFGKFNLPFFPSWLDIQFSEVPALFTSFMYGPVSGVLVIIVRFFCKLPGTSTVGVGELADVLIGVTLCLTSGLIYKKHRSFKGALCGLGAGMGLATVVACLANLWILIPAYVNLAGFPMPALVGIMNTYMNGVVTVDNFMTYYIFVGVLPFNLFRYALVFIVTVILYKRLHMLINMITGDAENIEEESN